MKVLMFSLDTSILENGSESQDRLAEYGEFLDKLVILVPGKSNKALGQNKNVSVIGISGFSKALVLIKMFVLSVRLLLKESFDLVTSQDTYYIGFCANVVSGLFRVPLEIQVHGFEKLRGLRYKMARFNLNKADLVRTVSERSKKMLKKDFGVNSYVLPVVSDIVVSTKIKQKEGKILLTVGRLVEVKDISLQIRALARLCKDFPDLVLWVVGDGPERTKLEEEARSLGVYDKVVFEGWREDIGEVYAYSDIFLLTSFSEGWGRVVIEAASYGLPIVMTDVGLAREFIVNGKNGLVIDIGNLDDLCSSIKKILLDQKFAETISLGAVESVKNIPGRRDVLESQINTWKEIIRDRK